MAMKWTAHLRNLPGNVAEELARATESGQALCGLAVILVAAMAPAWAQDPNAGDAPDHGVARLSFVQGNVSIRHGDLGELVPAAMNVPLVTTDRVVTGDTGSAEIQFDFTNMIRLGVSERGALERARF